MILDEIKLFFLSIPYRITILKYKLKVKIKRLKLTPKGECIYEYCQKIVDGSLLEKDKIEEYERYINLMMMGIEKEGISVTREEEAALICNALGLLMLK